MPWYLAHKIELSALGVAQDSLSFMVLFNYIVPISLYVTLELQKFFGSLFLIWDIQLYDEATNQPAKCNSSDLNEELGQVQIAPMSLCPYKGPSPNSKIREIVWIIHGFNTASSGQCIEITLSLVGALYTAGWLGYLWI